MRKKAKDQNWEKPPSVSPHPTGEKIIVLRPHLWSGYVGIVTGYDKEQKVNTIRVGKSHNSRMFESYAGPEYLQPVGQFQEV